MSKLPNASVALKPGSNLNSPRHSRVPGRVSGAHVVVETGRGVGTGVDGAHVDASIGCHVSCCVGALVAWASVRGGGTSVVETGVPELGGSVAPAVSPCRMGDPVGDWPPASASVGAGMGDVVDLAPTRPIAPCNVTAAVTANTGSAAPTAPTPARSPVPDVPGGSSASATISASVAEIAWARCLLAAPMTTKKVWGSGV